MDRWLHLAWDAGAEGAGPPEPAEARLARLSGAVGPLRRVLAAIAERLVATRAYERLCYARLSDYARERPGLSARQLHELARVHRALARLPALERALVCNELSWSKVRLLARVASAADEGTWIARARAASVRRLEQEVRASARAPAGDPDEAVPHARVALRCTPAVHEKWLLVKEVAERVAGEHLSAGAALECVVAEVFSGASLDSAVCEPPERALPSQGGEPGQEREDEAASGPRAPALDPPRAIAALARGLGDADAFELDRRLRLAVRLEQTLDAAVAPLLRCVACAEYEWSGDRYRRLAEYAPEQLGMSARKARALLRLERAGDVCPELRAAYRSGRLSWLKAQCLAPLLLLDIEGEWRPAWVAWAARVTLRRLAGDVERALLLRAGHDPAWQRCRFHPEQAQDEIPAAERQMCAHDVDTEATQELHWRVPREVALLFRALHDTLRARLEAEHARPFLEGEVFDAMLDGALLAWTLRDPRARRPDPVMERDGYRCAVPGCTSRRNLHDHHVVFRSAGGCDALDNRIALCAFHHERCLHQGLLRVSGRAPHDVVFELGLRSGAAPLARYRSGDIALPGRQGEVQPLAPRPRAA